MNLQMLLTFQLITDLIICAAILLLFVLILREFRSRSGPVDKESMSEFRKLVCAIATVDRQFPRHFEREPAGA